MAGQGYKLFTTGSVLTAAEVNTYLQEQTVMVFADATARTTALSGVLAEGMFTYLKDTDVLQYYSGASWVTVNTDQTPLTTKGDLFTYSTADARLAVGSNGDTLLADSSATTGLRWQGDYAAGKNKIINGDFGIWQRGTSGAGAGYLADRFQGVVTTTTITQSQQSFTAGTAPVAGYEGTFFYRAVTTSGGTAGSRALVQQPIEDVRTLAGQTATISFWAKAASGTPKIGVELAQVFGSGGSTAVTAIGATAVTISTSWTRYTVTASVPSVSGKTIGTGSSLNLVLWIDAGSDFATRASSIGNQSGTFDIWGVQVEAGSVATAFQTATGTLAGELAACQRYYFRITTTGASYEVLGSGYSISTTVTTITMPFPVPMRVKPTAVETTGTASNYAVLNGSGGVVACSVVPAIDSQNTNLTGLLSATVASGLTAGQGTQLRTNAGNAHIGWSAEL